jgi:hypothetical protein
MQLTLPTSLDPSNNLSLRLQEPILIHDIVRLSSLLESHAHTLVALESFLRTRESTQYRDTQASRAQLSLELPLTSTSVATLHCDRGTAGFQVKVTVSGRTRAPHSSVLLLPGCDLTTHQARPQPQHTCKRAQSEADTLLPGHLSSTRSAFDI